MSALVILDHHLAPFGTRNEGQTNLKSATCSDTDKRWHLISLKLKTYFIEKKNNRTNTKVNRMTEKFK